MKLKFVDTNEEIKDNDKVFLLTIDSCPYEATRKGDVLITEKGTIINLYSLIAIWNRLSLSKEDFSRLKTFVMSKGLETVYFDRSKTLSYDKKDLEVIGQAMLSLGLDLKILPKIFKDRTSKNFFSISGNSLII